MQVDGKIFQSPAFRKTVPFSCNCCLPPFLCFTYLLYHTLDFIHNMRLVTASEQDNASNYAMKGFAVGAAQWAGVGLFASALAYSFFPWYRRTQTVNKVMFDKTRPSKYEANIDCKFSFILSCALHWAVVLTSQIDTWSTLNAVDERRC